MSRFRTGPNDVRAGIYELIRLGARHRVLIAISVIAAVTSLAAHADAGGENVPAPLALAKQMRQAVVSIRTLVGNGTQPSTTGSGFFVGPNGQVVTNYHVVSMVVRKPELHRLELKLPGGGMAAAKVVAFSLSDDLAVLQLTTPKFAATRWVQVPKSTSDPAEGASIHAFGDASGMGVVSTRGHFSGLVNKAGFERYHFTGTLNPGMSGGPAVDGQGVLVGVNAARKRGAEQMGFLVPAARVRALLERSTAGKEMTPAAIGAEIVRQVAEFQRDLAASALGNSQPITRFGPYQATDFGAARLQCRPSSNAPDDDSEDPSAVAIEGFSCRMFNGLDLGDDTIVGQFSFSHEHYRAKTLNAMRFNALVDIEHRSNIGEAASKSMGASRCVDRFTLAGRDGKLPVRLTWCAQAYREFDGLYDVNVNMVTRGSRTEALVSKLRLVGVSWSQALMYTRRLLEGVQ